MNIPTEGELKGLPLFSSVSLFLPPTPFVTVASYYYYYSRPGRATTSRGMRVSSHLPALPELCVRPNAQQFAEDDNDHDYDEMTTLQTQTANYIYSLDDFIAKGSTCQVYKGYSKKSGEVRALKILNVRFNKELAVLFQREIDALLLLQHPNVVTFYAVEKEIYSGKQVLITEFCSGGTLSRFLHQPENYKGLDNQEFLTLLNDLVAGTKHLRMHGFVHRDIKPQNILRCCVDGQTVYKLADFGTAKPLKDEEEFMSLVGTEEYLHPAIYEAVFFKRDSQKFDATADLWSLGATLYHSAAGLPPFLPYGGRQNRTEMYRMITEKTPGVISGIQKHAGGPVEWSEDLPSCAPMTSELKKLITPVIAGLMENDPKRVWTFDKFFQASEKIINKTEIVCLDTTKPWCLQLYMDKEQTVNEIYIKLVEHCNLDMESQILFFRGIPLSETVQKTNLIRDLPPTSTHKPIIVISKYYNEDLGGLLRANDKVPDFHSNMTANAVREVAQELSQKAADFVIDMNSGSQISRHLCKTARDLRLHQTSLLDFRLSLLMGKKEWFFGLLTATGLDEVPSLITEEMGSYVHVNMKGCLQDIPEDISILVNEIKKKIEICDNHANFIQQQLTTSKELESKIYSQETCFYNWKCSTILSQHLEECKELMESCFLQTKKYISRREKTMTDLEKKRMHSHVKKLVNHAMEHCYPNDEKIYQLFNLYHRDYLEMDRRLAEMYDEIKEVNNKIQELTGRLTGDNLMIEKKKKEKKEKKLDILKKLTNSINSQSAETQKVKEEAKQTYNSLSLFQVLSPFELPSFDDETASEETDTSQTSQNASN